MPPRRCFARPYFSLTKVSIADMSAAARTFHVLNLGIFNDGKHLQYPKG